MVDNKITKELLVSPLSMQSIVLDNLSSTLEDGVVTTDYQGTPIGHIIDNLSQVGSGLVQENMIEMVKIMPHLAKNKSELGAHMYDDDSIDMHAAPSTAKFYIYVNFLGLRDSGYRPTDAEYVTTTIPIGSTITVSEIPFTILNDIEIKLYDTGKVFVEQIPNDNEMAINNIGVIDSTIIDNNSVKWIIFETTIKQVEVISFTEQVSKIKSLNKTLDLPGYLVGSEVNMVNHSTLDELKQLDSLTLIDPEIPSVIVNDYGNKVEYTIPDIFIFNSTIIGKVLVKTYVTKGYINLALNQMKIEDYKINLNSSTTTNSAATIKNIQLLTMSPYTLIGGRDAMDFDTMKKYIIENTMGKIVTPVNKNEIFRMGTDTGLTIKSAMDTLFHRKFVTDKELLPNVIVPAIGDILMHRSTFELFNLENSNITKTATTLLIKSGTVFKREGSVVTPVTDQFMMDMKCLSQIELTRFLKTNKLFYNPYSYIIDLDLENNTVESKIYDLDLPTLSNLKIVNTSVSTDINVNINTYSILKSSNGFQLRFDLKTDELFDNLEIDNIKTELNIPFGDVPSEMFKIYGTYVKDEKYILFDLDTSYYISDGLLKISNGVNDLIADKNMSLTSKMYISVFKSYNGDDTLLNMNEIEVEIGREVTGLWNTAFTEYNDNKYEKHTEDKLKVYEEIVYGEPKFIKDNEDNLVANILHNVGDQVFEEDGTTPVYEYKEGDLKEDEVGNYIVDLDKGVTRVVDILMLEYEFGLSDHPNTINWVKELLSMINYLMTNDIVNINKTLLDKTELVYKPSKSNDDLVIIANSQEYTIPSNVSPKVKVYTNASLDSTDLDKVRTIIGGILNSELTKDVIDIPYIKESIKAKLGSDFNAINLSNIDNGMELDIIRKEDDSSNNFLINKQLEIVNGRLVPKYDIDIEIINV